MIKNIFIHGVVSLICISISYGFSSILNDDEWKVDFFDDFDTFDHNNWQDQRIWVNNEKQCYVPDNQYNTREVSDGLSLIHI